ncbi:MAG: glutathione S-transferase family protein [Candidatus Sedimenticola sp. 20ELBAFRAG]
MDNKVTLYGPGYSSYVRSVQICCEEKGVDHNLQEIKLPSKSLLGLNPFGRVPVIVHGDVTVYESAAICRYIDRTFEGPSLSPVSTDELAWMDQWISAANCYFDSAFIRRYVLEFAFPKGENGRPDRTNIRAAQPEVERHLGIAGQALEQAAYFSGVRPGIADYLILPMLDYLQRVPGGRKLVESQAAVSRYVENLLERPACAKILSPAW